jgi:hypothetical protein
MPRLNGVFENQSTDENLTRRVWVAFQNPPFGRSRSSASEYVVRGSNPDLMEPSEIGAIERQQVLDAVKQHGGDKASIVSRLSSHVVISGQLPPQVEDTLLVMQKFELFQPCFDLEIRRVRRGSESVFLNRTGDDDPVLLENLRNEYAPVSVQREAVRRLAGSLA